ncbi:extracellular solute-binding protein [Zestomonas carbonaria]|uniref:Putrescine-binding periplasmic protein n=1 Tax=Zestomonas carbonaria TaxID=2762745 RepID=A0A7U7I739_9GAMM|nr:extracellular solute-binding protein [Pseudomonas carbonaria]CAD5105790.1 Putrescine-binding periplasmic protein SpuD [Pseudomonas carbonaria]
MSRLLASLLFVLTPLLAQAGDTIRVYNWNDYIDPQVLVDFEKDTGIQVEYHTYSTIEELLAALASGEAIDVAVPSNDNLAELIAAGRLQPLDSNLLPNRSHLDKQLLSKLAADDSGNRYALPYLWGAVGLAVNEPQAQAAFGGPLPDSWSLLFDPEQSARLSSCGISVLDAQAEVMAVLLNYQGHNLTRTAPRQIQRAGQALAELRPHLRYIDSERYIDDLKNGKLCLALAWMGDALAAADAGQPVRFIIPEEGTTLFIDNLVIPSSARRADLAHRFIDYLMQPQVAARISAETLFPSANVDAREFLGETLKTHPGLYPDRETKRRLFLLEPLPEKLATSRDATWTRFRDGQ